MKKSFKFIFIALLLIIGLSTISYANVSVSTTSISIKTDESKSVTVAGNGVTGTLSVSSSNPNVATASTSTNWIENNSATVTVTGKSAGNATITISGTVADSNTGAESNYNKTISVTVASNQTSSGNANSNSGNTGSTTTQQPQTPTKSNVATLSNLGIKPNDFSGFKTNTYSYTAKVPNEVDKIEIYAYKGHSGQTISGTGANKTLKVGENKFDVNVTAEDGKTTKTYTINVIRKETEEEVNEEPVTEPKEDNNEEVEAFGLSELKIEGLQLNPEFQTDIYEYKIDLKEDLDKLDIIALATHIDTNIEISGNENLIEGENIITIVVKQEDEEDNTSGNKIATYQIIVNKDLTKEETETNNNGNLDKKIILIVAGVAIALIVIITIILKISKNKSNDGEYVSYTDFYSEDIKEIDEDEQIEEEEENSYEKTKKKKRSKGKRFK